MKKLDNPDDEVYINVVFKIKRGLITKLIDFLKQNTKSYLYFWEQGKQDEKTRED